MTELTMTDREVLRDAYRRGADVYGFAKTEYGLGRDKLRELLKDFITEADRHARFTKAFPMHFTNEDIYAAIRAVPCVDPKAGPTVTEYRSASSLDGDLPSVALLINRFGTFNAALAAAGYSRKISTRSDRKWSREVVERSLATIASALGPLPSIDKYEHERKRHADWPSAATIRLRIGSWSEARQLTLDSLRH